MATANKGLGKKLASGRNKPPTTHAERKHREMLARKRHAARRRYINKKQASNWEKEQAGKNTKTVQTPGWFLDMSTKQRKDYLAKHPNSRLHKSKSAMKLTTIKSKAFSTFLR